MTDSFKIILQSFPQLNSLLQSSVNAWCIHEGREEVMEASPVFQRLPDNAAIP